MELSIEKLDGGMKEMDSQAENTDDGMEEELSVANWTGSEEELREIMFRIMKRERLLGEDPYDIEKIAEEYGFNETGSSPHPSELSKFVEEMFMEFFHTYADCMEEWKTWKNWDVDYHMDESIGDIAYYDMLDAVYEGDSIYDIARNTYQKNREAYKEIWFEEWMWEHDDEHPVRAWQISKYCEDGYFRSDECPDIIIMLKRGWNSAGAKEEFKWHMTDDEIRERLLAIISDADPDDDERNFQGELFELGEALYREYEKRASDQAV